MTEILYVLVPGPFIQIKAHANFVAGRQKARVGGGQLGAVQDRAWDGHSFFILPLLPVPLLPFFVYFSYDLYFQIIHHSLDPTVYLVFLGTIMCPGPGFVVLSTPENYST